MIDEGLAVRLRLGDRKAVAGRRSHAVDFRAMTTSASVSMNPKRPLADLMGNQESALAGQPALERKRSMPAAIRGPRQDGHCTGPAAADRSRGGASKTGRRSERNGSDGQAVVVRDAREAPSLDTP